MDEQLNTLVEFIQHTHPDKLSRFSTKDNGEPGPMHHLPSDEDLTTTRSVNRTSGPTVAFAADQMQNYAQDSVKDALQSNLSNAKTKARSSRGFSFDQFIANNESSVKADVFRDVAHALHFVSIAILGFLVLEVGSLTKWASNYKIH